MANIIKKEINLNEQDTLQDMLDMEKLVMDSYLLAIKEGSTKNLRSTFMENFYMVSDDQYTLFKQMQEKGYYVLEPAQMQMVEQTTKEYTKTSKAIAEK